MLNGHGWFLAYSKAAVNHTNTDRPPNCHSAHKTKIMSEYPSCCTFQTFNPQQKAILGFRTHTMPRPCHAAPLPFSDSAVSFVKVRVVAGIGRTRAGRPHAVSGRPMLIHTCHAVPMPRCAVALRGRFQNGMVVAWHGNGTGAVYHV
jgi:hypothetical protein